MFPHIWSKWSRYATLSEHELMLSASEHSNESYNAGTYACALAYAAIMRSAGLPILRIRMPDNSDILLILFNLGIAPTAVEEPCPHEIHAEEEIPEDGEIVVDSAGDLSGVKFS